MTITFPADIQELKIGMGLAIARSMFRLKEMETDTFEEQFAQHYGENDFIRRAELWRSRHCDLVRLLKECAERALAIFDYSGFQSANISLKYDLYERNGGELAKKLVSAPLPAKRYIVDILCNDDLGVIHFRNCLQAFKDFGSEKD